MQGPLSFLKSLATPHDSEASGYKQHARVIADAARAAMRLHLTNSRERLRHAHEEAEAQRG